MWGNGYIATSGARQTPHDPPTRGKIGAELLHQLNTGCLNMSRESYHRSCLLNAQREVHCAAISAGVNPGIKHDTEGWYPVSFHLAGKQSAWVQQAKLRKRWPNLLTEVRDWVQDNKECAAIFVKRNV